MGFNPGKWIRCSFQANPGGPTSLDANYRRFRNYGAAFELVSVLVYEALGRLLPGVQSHFEAFLDEWNDGLQVLRFVQSYPDPCLYCPSAHLERLNLHAF